MISARRWSCSAPATISEADAARLREATGLREGGLVVVRPDGYIGHVGAVAEAVEALRYDVGTSVSQG